MICVLVENVQDTGGIISRFPFSHRGAARQWYGTSGGWMHLHQSKTFPEITDY